MGRAVGRLVPGGAGVGGVGGRVGASRGDGARLDRGDAPTDLHRAPAGRLLRPAAGGSPVPESLGFDAFFRSDHYLSMGSGRRAARAHRRLGHPGRYRPGDQPDPPGHPGHLGHLPAPRSAGRLGGRGRRHERGPGRARASGPGGSRPSTPPTGSPSRRWASGSSGWRSSWPSSPGCGPPRRRAVQPGGPSTTRSRTARPCPSRSSVPAHRSSSAVATGPSGPRGWPPPIGAEFNLAFRSLEETGAQFERGPGRL
jgi:hypothetical protein